MTAATPETLAHEIGHTLDLDHYGSTANDNVMWKAGTQGRNIYTIGQVFRMNLNTNSGLNALNVRSGPTRNCAHGDVNDTCPDITLDATPK